ncbi:MAG: hypothetical protein SWY16_17760 [Cyanobacteriota bacterium]|nr:hypothetical protein [Cyanobacteriota bacterium]
MLVVSNTSPISYLVVIEQIDLLSRLFERIFIPEVVRDELTAPNQKKRIIMIFTSFIRMNTILIFVKVKIKN